MIHKFITRSCSIFKVSILAAAAQVIGWRHVPRSIALRKDWQQILIKIKIRQQRGAVAGQRSQHLRTAKHKIVFIVT